MHPLEDDGIWRLLWWHIFENHFSGNLSILGHYNSVVSICEPPFVSTKRILMVIYISLGELWSSKELDIHWHITHSTARPLSAIRSEAE